MAVIIIVVGYGTIVESEYNSELARIKVYHTWWFSFLMTLLWINIFFAALSRWPWKWHHLGFLTTHLGLLILLIGGFITTYYGIDGSLRLLEGETSGTVVLPDLVLEVATNNGMQAIVPISKNDHELNGRAASQLFPSERAPFIIEKYLPFSALKQSIVSRGSFKNGLNEDSTRAQRSAGDHNEVSPPGEMDQWQDGPVAIEFNIKSPFFDVNEVLHSENKKSINMGPATFSLREKKTEKVINKIAKQGAMKQKSVKNSSASILIIKDKSSGKISKKVEITSKVLGQALQVGEFTVKAIHYFQRARVGQGGIVDSAEGELNPALELQIENNGKPIRDVVFAKFSGFTLIQDPQFPLSFEFQDKGSGEIAAESMSMSSNTPENEMSQNSNNQVVFEYDRMNPDQVNVELSKAGKTLLTQKIRPQETVTTPWMGIKITLKNLYQNAQEKNELLPVEPELKANILPPSALLIRPLQSTDSESFWITEGEEKTFQSNNQSYSLFYGNKNIQLPFKIKLEKFSKIDYPGTNLAKSYESVVEVTHTKKQTTISMNEPLEEDGYVLYQSSYEELPGGHFASIFSVNKDPGRPLKYWGSLILCLGIIIFTLMRSRFYQKWIKKI